MISLTANVRCPSSWVNPSGTEVMRPRHHPVVSGSANPKAAFWLVKYLEGLLWGVSGHDPLSYAAVPVVLLASTVLACWVPARRAARIDPLIALRQR